MPASPPEPDDAQPRSAAPVRWALMVLAVLALVLAVAGVFLPGLPTVPFLLVAAWASARSSPRLHAWLLRHRVFGPLIADWERGGRVSRRSKWHASIAMAVCAAVLLWLSPRAWAAGLAIACMAGVLAWLWRRPEP